MSDQPSPALDPGPVRVGTIRAAIALGILCECSRAMHSAAQGLDPTTLGTDYWQQLAFCTRLLGITEKAIELVRDFSLTVEGGHEAQSDSTGTGRRDATGDPDRAGHGRSML